MSYEKTLYESEMIIENITESTLNAPETIAPGTGQTDIAQQVPKTKLARNVISQTLPFMIGFVQPLNTPSGFVFGFKERADTDIGTGREFPLSNQQPPSAERYGTTPGTPPAAGDISYPSTTRDPADPMTIADYDGLKDASGTPENPAIPAGTSPVTPEDPVIIRRLVETEVREVIFDLSNEAIQDLNSLFSSDFPGLLDKFIEQGGELFGFDTNTDYLSASLESFFLPQMISKIATKINEDFINWADQTATSLGTVDIPTIDKMPNIFVAIGEMRKALAEQTNKSGSIFIIATPRIANYIAGTLGMTMSNGSDALEIGKPNQNPHLNGFIGQYGDIKVYQYRGTRTNPEETIIIGFDGSNGPNTASVYYHPYKEYIIQGGDNYMTGHSNIFYRVRDTWGVNPLDTFDKSQTDPIIDPGITTGTSQYLVRADFTFGETVIIP